MNLKQETGSYSEVPFQLRLLVASVFWSEHSMLETWMIFANALKNIELAPVVRMVDVISRRYVYWRGVLPESKYFSRTFIYNSHSLFEQVGNECV